MGASAHAPRVAVVIPVYRARFLGEALDSVFNQTRAVDEVIVVDDGSPDQHELRRALAPYGARVTVIRQDNQGAGAARNAGINAARAELIALLDADDRWLPRFIREQLEMFSARPDLDLCYTDGRYIGGTPLAGRTFMSACPSRGAVTVAQLLAQECTVLLSAVVAKRQAILDAGGFDPALRRGQDFDLWLRMCRRGARMTYLRQVLMLRREHADNLSGTPINEMERPLAVLRKTLATMTLSDVERAIIHRRVAALEAGIARERGKALLGAGDITAARRAFADARGGLPPWKLHAARWGLRIAPQLVRRVYLARRANAPS